ncbi:MAG TPA: glycosyltransferase 61 family protein [Aridibacter sp.]|nr:glycosyltransferase 61 family protein [Aridibacter sp.]
MFSPKNSKKDKLIEGAAVFKRRLPRNIFQGDKEFFEGNLTYSTFNCLIRSFRKVKVTSDSIAYKNGFLIPETLYSDENYVYYQTRYPIKQFFFARRKALDPRNRYLLATDYYSSGHFHWLTEVLPRLFVAREFLRDAVVLLPDTTYIRQVGIPSIERIGLKCRDIALLQEGYLYEIPELLLVTKLSRTGQYHDGVLRSIRSALGSNQEEGTKRIYVSRERAAFRKVLNESELVPVLRSAGFEVFRPEELSFDDQFELFSGSKTIMGIHGAGLTNCLFMPPSGQVVEFRLNETNVGYWFLADALGHDYYYFNGVPDSGHTVIGRGSNLTIPPKLLEEKVLELL